MNEVHALVLARVRDAIARGKIKADWAQELTDEALLPHVFSNYRDGRGLKLSTFGKNALIKLFKSFTIALDSRRKIVTRVLLFLDKRASMPYYLGPGGKKLIMFESELALMIKLAGGDIETVIDSES